MIRERKYAEHGCLSCNHFVSYAPVDLVMGKCRASGGAPQDWEEVNAMQTCEKHIHTRSGKVLRIEPKDVMPEEDE